MTDEPATKAETWRAELLRRRADGFAGAQPSNAPALPGLTMHEFSIASGLVEKLLEFNEKNPEKKIVEVRVAIGEFTQIEEEQLRFCYESIITEMPIAGSSLTIETIPGKVRCAYCSYQGAPKYWERVLSGAPVATLQCPSCGKAARATEGEDCAIRSVRFTQPDEMQLAS